MRLFAHGIGGAKDLPIPAEYAIAGACAALAVSFTVLALAWRTPRFNTGDRRPRPAPGWVADMVDGPWFAPLLRVLGFAFFLYVAAAAVFGKDLLINPFFGVFFVLLWVGIVPMSLFFGPFYKAISPVRTINLLLAKLSGSDPEVGLRDYPRWLGHWPAAVGLFAFVWFELVYPFSTELGPARLWCAAYVGVMLIGGAVFGNRFFENADPFEVYSTLVSRLSVWGRDGDGNLVVRSPLANLDLTPVRPGLLAVCSVLLGSTAFDSFKDSSTWLTTIQSTDIDTDWLNLAALLGFVLAVGILFGAATMMTGIHDDHHRLSLPGQFAHSLVPIIVGYVVAHYLSYLVEVGQQTVIYLSDPFSTGANLLGTGNRAVNYWLSNHPTFLALTKVGGVITGHVVAVIAAHDRAVKLLPKRHQLTGQLSLLVVMVGFTIGGLYLLFGA
ncbi:hypothetical protein EKO23_18210 [Nocardioides guangzhouensis]|uniref:Fenitrothion hydrolase n=1 Tax=Nocardioides guangzhouensis TaxID=2497878 RepID=A0A4Q4Z923_9ACTN|nr:hypothetical protein [Nocardioides guangzhouensis]RYP83691.1 hypothetical protein EKO23_18210 [Nocardioides guangzhouensis]